MFRIELTLTYFHLHNIAVLSLFTVYQWNNGLCTASTGEYGNCLTNQQDCIGRGGIPGGPCAEGHGACCVCTFMKPNRIVYIENDKKKLSFSEQSWPRVAELFNRTAPTL